MSEARAHGEGGHAAWSLHLLGEISLTEANSIEAEMFFTEAEVLSETLEMRPLRAHCRFGLARSHKQRRRHGKANDALSVARKMYQAMGMTYWIDQSERF